MFKMLLVTVEFGFVGVLLEVSIERRDSHRRSLERVAGRWLGGSTAVAWAGHPSVLPPCLRALVLRSHRPSSSQAQSR